MLAGGVGGLTLVVAAGGPERQGVVAASLTPQVRPRQKHQMAAAEDRAGSFETQELAIECFVEEVEGVAALAVRLAVRVAAVVSVSIGKRVPWSTCEQVEF
jgi:hypothetical protein